MSVYVKSMCVVAKCCATNLKRDRSLFAFPADEERCLQWVKACGAEREYNLLRKYKTHIRNTGKRVCGIHFEDRYFKSDKRKRLSDDAVPTLYLTEKVPPTIVRPQRTVTAPSEDSIVLQEHSYSVQSRTEQESAGSSAMTSQSTEAGVPVGVQRCITCGVLSTGDQPVRKRQRDQVTQTPISMLLGAYDVETIRTELKAARLRLRTQVKRIKRLETQNAKLKLELQSKPRTAKEWLAELPAEDKASLLKQLQGNKSNADKDRASRVRQRKTIEVQKVANPCPIVEPPGKLLHSPDCLDCLVVPAPGGTVAPKYPIFIIQHVGQQQRQGGKAPNS